MWTTSSNSIQGITFILGIVGGGELRSGWDAVGNSVSASIDSVVEGSFAFSAGVVDLTREVGVRARISTVTDTLDDRRRLLEAGGGHESEEPGRVGFPLENKSVPILTPPSAHPDALRSSGASSFVESDKATVNDGPCSSISIGGDIKDEARVEASVGKVATVFLLCMQPGTVNDPEFTVDDEYLEDAAATAFAAVAAAAKAAAMASGEAVAELDMERR